MEKAAFIDVLSKTLDCTINFESTVAAVWLGTITVFDLFALLVLQMMRFVVAS